MTGISETEVATLFSKSQEFIRQYVENHPDVFYKGVPIAFIVWMVYPFLFAAWSWLPWIWVSCQIYRCIPEGTFPLVMSLFKDKKWIFDVLPGN